MVEENAVSGLRVITQAGLDNVWLKWMFKCNYVSFLLWVDDGHDI